MKTLTGILLLAISLAGCSHAPKDSTQQADSTNMARDSGDNEHSVSYQQEVSGDDARFAVKAAAGGMAEVELGQLAQQKGSTPAVKDFGAMMVKDHSAANQEMAALAKSEHITLPATLDAGAQKLKAELGEKTGADFDKAYAEAMVKDHEEDTTLFSRAIKIVKTPNMTAFAKKTLPVLKMHLEAAQKIKASLK